MVTKKRVGILRTIKTSLMLDPKKFFSGKKSDLFQIIEKLNEFTKTCIEEAVH